MALDSDMMVGKVQEKMLSCDCFEARCGITEHQIL